MTKVDVVAEYEGINQLPDILLAIVARHRAFKELLSDLCKLSLDNGLFLIFRLAVAYIAYKKRETSDCNRLLGFIHYFNLVIKVGLDVHASAVKHTGCAGFQRTRLRTVLSDPYTLAPAKPCSSH